MSIAYTYASGTVSLTLAKNIPTGLSLPMAFCSMGRSVVVIREERFRLKYWATGDLGWAKFPPPLGGGGREELPMDLIVGVVIVGI